MDLSSINPLWGMAIAVLCCVGGVLILVVLNVIGGLFGVGLGILEIGLDLFSGGPIAWCGCLVVLLGCCGCTAITIMAIRVLSTCGTPDAVNFCRFF